MVSKLGEMAARVLRRGRAKVDVQSFEDWGVRWRDSTGVGVHECDDRDHAEEWARNVFADAQPEVVRRTRAVAYSPWQAASTDGAVQ